MIDNNHNGYSSNQLPPSSASGIPSVRNSTKRQRLVIPVNSGKRQPVPLSYDPNLSDQRRKGNAYNIQLTQPNNPSADSRGNQSNSSYNSKGAAHIISKKYISFAGQSQNSNVSNQNQLTSRQNASQNNTQTDHSPRDFPSGRETKKGSSRGQQQQQQRKQLAFRRQQVMDITDDANTNSMRTLNANNEDNTATLTIESQAEPISIQRNNAFSQPPPAYNYFYQVPGNEGVLNRLNSKKSFRVIQTGTGGQSNQNLVKQSSKNDLLTSSMTKQAINEQFQFTRKQNLIGDSSVSSTREKGGQLFTLKKQSIQNINQQTTGKEPQIPQIGKRRPLIIRKNNFIQANGNNHPQNQTQPISNINISAINNENISQISPNQTSNMNTLFSANSGRMNNTNSIGGLTSDASLSQTRHGITQILKSLNSTTQSNDIQNHSLKDPKLIKINQSKKKLDTARKSRLQQLQHEPQNMQQLQQISQLLSSTAPHTTNSLSQQPDQRNGSVYLGNLNKKKRSFLIPKVKIENTQQQNNVISSFNPTSKPSARQESQRNYAQSTVVPQKGLIQISAESTQNVEQILKQISMSEERDHTQESSNPKVLTRGQLMRIVKKQHNETNNQNNNLSKVNAPQIFDVPMLNKTIQRQPDKIIVEPREEKNQNSSLTRVESKKELGSKHTLIDEKKFIEKHQVRQELVILEQLNDSSCTPGDFQSLNNMTQFSPEKKIDYIVENDFTETQNEELKLETIEVTQDKRKSEQVSIQPFNLSSQPIQEEKSSIDKSKPLIETKEVQKKNTEPIPYQINPIVQPKSHQNQITQNKSENKEAKLENQILSTGSSQQQQTSNNKQRLLNNSAVEVKSPIGTATSFKSQNSQQAGPNLEEIIVRQIVFNNKQKFPMKPGKALKLFLNQLTDYEKGEILDYQDVYFLGLNAQKIHGSPKNEYNYGFDDDKGDYKVIMKDHVGYRYEIVEFLGKGSFGTALKCFDHKNKEEVALKIVKNKKKYQYQAGVELKLLNFLKENDPDDIMNVIHMKDYVIFRKHLCISFELLSMNLFEFLKINDFNGFDHNLIRRFAIQLLYALKYLKEFQIIHCDLKPENILLKEPNKSGIKIIDFGSSAFIDERVYTYIQSRFYRAPEIMLGIPYTCAIDMWSFGCIMAELYIGYPIFPGESENDQMSRIIEMINIPNRNVYEQSQRRHKFFTQGQNGNDYEAIMLKNSRGKLRKPGGKPLSLLLGDEDLDFLDFVQKCLEWDPETRLSPDDALRHIWVLKGLPPQVLIHHQRMHNIQTPELPEPVREARDKFFLEMTIQNDNNSQLGSRVKSSQQQSSKSNQNSNGKQKQSQIKNETIKSLERAQLKNQLHQLNPQKIHQQANQLQLPMKQGNIVIHSKVNPPQIQNLEVKNSFASNKDDPSQTFKSPKFQTIVNSEGNKIFKRRANPGVKTKIVQ